MSDPAPFDLLAGRYRLESRIGSGRSGDVWRATDTVLNRPVAVKLMRPERVRQQLAARRFQAQARHAGSIAHQAIAKVYDYEEGTPSQRPFLVMEYVPGSSLAEELSAGPLGPARAMDIVAQIAAGLDAAHTVGFAHGDIKPHNVLLGGDGRVKLTDFGVWFAPGATGDTMPGTLLGTPEYQAPERMTGGMGNAASDLYSLGVVAYQCLTGRVPFRGRAVDVAHAHRSWPLPSLPAGTPPQVERLVAELTAKDPELRPASAGDVARRAATLRDELALDPPVAEQASELVAQATDGSAGSPAGPAAGSAPARRGPGRWRGPTLLGAGAVIVVAAACIGLFLATRPGGESGGGPPAVRLVDVNDTALRGQPVATVAARLRSQGMIVTIQWATDSGTPAGLVISVRPSGWLAPGGRVLIIGAASPGTTTGPSRRRTTAPVLPGLPPPVAPTLPLRHSGPPTSSSSPAPSPIPTLTGSPSPSPSVTPTPTSPSAMPSPTSWAAAGARPAPVSSPGDCAISATQWVTVSLTAGPRSAAQCTDLVPLRT